MRRRNSRVTRRWVIQISIVILVLCMISFTYAAYTNYSYMKGVAVSKMNSTAFSSNYLRLAEKSVSDDTMETVIIPIQVDDKGATTSQSLVFQIRNYSANNPSEPNMDDITYTIEFIVKSQEGKELGQGYELDNLVMTKDADCYKGQVESTLQGEKLELNQHRLTIPTQDFSHIEVYVKAIPNESSLPATNQQVLAAKVVFTEYSTESESSANWVGNLVDINLDEPTSSQEYAALNYELTGTGVQEITLQWDASQFELDPYFIHTMSEDTGADIRGSLDIAQDQATLSLHVDSNIKEYYLLQFYRKQPISAEETWETLNEMFTFNIK